MEVDVVGSAGLNSIRNATGIGNNLGRSCALGMMAHLETWWSPEKVNCREVGHLTVVAVCACGDFKDKTMQVLRGAAQETLRHRLQTPPHPKAASTWATLTVTVLQLWEKASKCFVCVAYKAYQTARSGCSHSWKAQSIAAMPTPRSFRPVVIRMSYCILFCTSSEGFCVSCDEHWCMSLLYPGIGSLKVSILVLVPVFPEKASSCSAAVTSWRL